MTMFDFHIISMVPKGNSAIEIEFADHTRGIFCVEDLPRSGVFMSIHNEQSFNRVQLDPVFHSLCWGNEIDIAPEYVYAQVTSKSMGQNERK